jgi:hypothetical protein
MRIILWSTLSRSLRSLRFGPGECFGFFLGRVLRASVAPKGFALHSSPRDLLLPAADPMEGDDRLGDARVLSVLFPPLSAFLLATTWDGR